MSVIISSISNNFKQMPVRLFILTITILILLSCNSNSAPQPSLVNTGKSSNYSDTNNVTKPGKQQSNMAQYAYIVRILQKEDSTFLDADFIQYLTGEAAIEAAKKAHQADTFQIDGKTHIDVANDYFILNERTKIRRFPISKDCVFDLIINPDRTPLIKDNSLISLKKVYADSPFVLTITPKGVVVKIKEVFIP